MTSSVKYRSGLSGSTSTFAASAATSLNSTSSAVGPGGASTGMSSSDKAATASLNAGIPVSSIPLRTASSTMRSLVDIRVALFMYSRSMI